MPQTIPDGSGGDILEPAKKQLWQLDAQFPWDNLDGQSVLIFKIKDFGGDKFPFAEKFVQSFGRRHDTACKHQNSVYLYLHGVVGCGNKQQQGLIF